MSKKSERRPVILVLAPFYLPGFKGGGPIRSIANMVEALHDEFGFRIVTADRDLGDTHAYRSVKVDEWNSVGPASVLFVSPRMRTLRGLVDLLRTVEHDAIYLNSFFDPEFTLRIVLARWLGLVPKRALVIAPRGEFSTGALRLRRWKKVPYVLAMKCLAVYRSATWHASTDLEAEDVRRVMGSRATVRIAGNCTVLEHSLLPDGRATDMAPRSQALRICFLSRISPKKNLAFALRVLSEIQCDVVFDIYGPCEDQSYWRDCVALIAKLPRHVSATYRGAVAQADVQPTLSRYDLLFVPTQGENFGHVFAEALASGVPLLVSDQTPWRGLQARGVGWDFPLGSQRAFVQAIEEACLRTPEQRQQIARACVSFAREKANSVEAAEQTRLLFLRALAPAL